MTSLELIFIVYVPYSRKFLPKKKFHKFRQSERQCIVQKFASFYFVLQASSKNLPVVKI